MIHTPSSPSAASAVSTRRLELRRLLDLNLLTGPHKEIAASRLRGETLTSIATRLNLSRARVHQIEASLFPGAARTTFVLVDRAALIDALTQIASAIDYPTIERRLDGEVRAYTLRRIVKLGRAKRTTIERIAHLAQVSVERLIAAIPSTDSNNADADADADRA